MLAKTIVHELKHHIPFTAAGAVLGVLVVVLFSWIQVPQTISTNLFWVFHPLHVLLSAMVTAAVYRVHTHAKWWQVVLVGYFGSIGVATLSDSIIPYVGEILLDLPHRAAHIGAIEKWWLVNPLALAGIGIAFWRPHTLVPHAGHVFLSTWASLFHLMMAMGTSMEPVLLVPIALFLFLAVLVPCCTSDIVFPLLFVTKKT